VSELAIMPELNKVSKLARTPELLWVFAFVRIVWVAPLPPQLLATTFEIIAPIDLRSMAAMGVPPGDVLIALTFPVAASTFGGGGVGVCDIVALLGESLV
jgi:hypothetical protein